MLDRSLVPLTATIIAASIAPELSAVAHAQVAPVADGEVEEIASFADADEASEIVWLWSTGGSYQFDADLDDGGSYELARASTGIAASMELDPTLRLDVGLAYEYDRFDFSGSTGFGGLDPWDEIHSLRLRAQFTYIVDERWAVFASPIVSFSVEDGASISDGITAGGIIGARYRASETLSYGFGFGGFSQIEDDPVFFPVLTLDWKPADGVVVRSGTLNLGSSGGQGVEVFWDMGGGWQLGGGVQYQTRRFRLDDRGVAPDGVGDQTAVPIYVRSRWTFDSGVSCSVFAGVVVGGELLLENDRGGRVSRQDYDPAPVAGARVTVRF